jgi:hypothetical protein
MIDIKAEIVEKEIVKVLEEIRNDLELEIDLNTSCSPGDLMMSQILVTAISRIGQNLGIAIPLGCYIFFDNHAEKQLTIKEAALKLIKQARHESKQLK